MFKLSKLNIYKLTYIEIIFNEKINQNFYFFMVPFVVDGFDWIR